MIQDVSLGFHHFLARKRAANKPGIPGSKSMANALKNWFGLAAVAALGGALYLNRRQLLARLLKLPPPQNKRDQTARCVTSPCPMAYKVGGRCVPPRWPAACADGAACARPTAVPTSTRFFATLFAERGFHVVAQDVRGRFGAEGHFEPYVQRSRRRRGDVGLDCGPAVEQRPYAACGARATLGFVQWAAADDRHPAPARHAAQPSPRPTWAGQPTRASCGWTRRCAGFCCWRR
jgi:hypothetical protein